jgi:hypothetical protein
MLKQSFWLGLVSFGLVVGLMALAHQPTASAACGSNFTCQNGYVCQPNAGGGGEGVCVLRPPTGCPGGATCTAITQGHTVTANCAWNNVICFCPFSGNPNYQITSNACGH